MMDTPYTDAYASQTRCNSHPVCALIAIQTIPTVSLTIRQNDRVFVVNMSINEIKDITKDDRGKRHVTPILAQSINAEGFSNKRWIDTEEEAVAQACESGNEAKNMGVVDTSAADLSYKEDAARDKEAPKTRHAELSYYDIGANAWEGG